MAARVCVFCGTPWEALPSPGDHSPVCSRCGEPAPALMYANDVADRSTDATSPFGDLPPLAPGNYDAWATPPDPSNSCRCPGWLVVALVLSVAFAAAFLPPAWRNNPAFRQMAMTFALLAGVALFAGVRFWVRWEVAEDRRVTRESRERRFR